LNGCYKPGFPTGKEPIYPDHPYGMLEENPEPNPTEHFSIYEPNEAAKDPNNIVSKTKTEFNPFFPHPSVPSLEQDGDETPSLNPNPLTSLSALFEGSVHLCDSKTNCVE
jgi:hypothetical protein